MLGLERRIARRARASTSCLAPREQSGRSSQNRAPERRESTSRHNRPGGIVVVLVLAHNRYALYILHVTLYQCHPCDSCFTKLGKSPDCFCRSRDTPGARRHICRRGYSQFVAERGVATPPKSAARPCERSESRCLKRTAGFREFHTAETPENRNRSIHNPEDQCFADA